MKLTHVLYMRSGGVAELTKKFSNLPESYIKRSLERVQWMTPRGLPQYLPKKILRRNSYFGLHRPWTEGFWRDNERSNAKIFLEPIKDWSIFKGDRVEILVGHDKGKQGTVIQVIQERNWVIVEGLNCKLKVMGKSKSYPGTVMQEEQPLLVTKDVRLVDPSDFQGTSVEWRFTEDGEKVRVSVRTGRIIPIPKQAEETYDYKTKSTYKESVKDTVDSEVSKITFSPELCTFGMDIMKKLGIKENRIPAKSYWY